MCYMGYVRFSNIKRIAGIQFQTETLKCGQKVRKKSGRNAEEIHHENEGMAQCRCSIS